MTNGADSHVHLKAAEEHQRAGRFAEAESVYRKILSAEPENAVLWNMLGALYSAWGDQARAARSFSKAVRLDQTNHQYPANLAAALTRLGDIKEADKTYRSAIKRAPGDARSYLGLVNLHALRARDPLGKAFESLGAEETLKSMDPESRPHAMFAAARFEEDRRKFARAFTLYEDANAAAARRARIRDMDQRVSSLKKTFNKSFFRSHDQSGLPTQTPVFVIGLPCSGAAYVEAVLAAHPKVHVAGQRQDMGGVAKALGETAASQRTDKSGQTKAGKAQDREIYWTRALSGAEPDLFTGFAAAYLKNLMRDSPLVPRVVDSMGDNFLYVGLIHLLFPEARIIHMVRDPLDVCFSCYAQYFAKGHDYAFDLKAMGAYYRAYERLMAHWDTVLPGRLYRISYEDLRRAPVSQIRGLMDHLGLAWDAKAKPPKKIWADQTPEGSGPFQPGMRQTGPVGRARPFAKYLGPLKTNIKTRP